MNNYLEHYSHALKLCEQGQYLKAIEEIHKALDFEPNSAVLHNGLGKILQEQGDFKEAVKEKEKAVELSPDEALYHQSLGTAYHLCNQKAKAVFEMYKAIELQPENADYYYSMGLILKDMYQMEEAKEYIKKAIELSPDNPEFHTGLSVVLYKSENSTRCRKEAQAEKIKANELFLHKMSEKRLVEFEYFRDGHIPSRFGLSSSGILTGKRVCRPHNCIEHASSYFGYTSKRLNKSELAYITEILHENLLLVKWGAHIIELQLRCKYSDGSEYSFRSLHQIMRSCPEAETASDQIEITLGRLLNMNGVIKVVKGTVSNTIRTDFMIEEGKTIHIGEKIYSDQESFGNNYISIDNAKPYDNMLSKNHCTVEYAPPENMYYVTDLSENGTYVFGGSRLEPRVRTELNPGEIIILGNENYILQLI